MPLIRTSIFISILQIKKQTQRDKKFDQDHETCKCQKKPSTQAFQFTSTCGGDLSSPIR